MCIIIAVSQISVFAIGLAGIPLTLVTSTVNIFPNRKLLGYSYIEQLVDILPNLLRALFMAAIVYLVRLILPFPLIVNLIIQVMVGAVIYVAESIIFKVDTFEFLLNTLKSLIKK